MSTKNQTIQNLDVKEISIHEYEAFLEGKDYSALQAVGQFNRMTNSRIYGGYQNGQLKIAMIVKIIPAMKIFKWAYSPRGYVCEDLLDTSLVQAFMQPLKKQLAKENVLYIRIESPIEYVQRDANGDVVEGGYSHESYRQDMKNIGFEIEELKRDGYDLTRQCRWVSILDLVEYTTPYDGLPVPASRLANPDGAYTFLSKEQLMKNLNVKTRQHVKLSQKEYVKVRELSYDELSILKEMEEAAAAEHHYESNSIEAYQASMKGYGDACKVLYAYVDLNTYKTCVEKDQQENEKALQEALLDLETNPDSKKKNRRVQTLQEQKATLKKKEEDVKELCQRFDQEVPLAAALFLLTPTETLYLFSGSKKEFARFKGAYAIQWHMICESLERKALRYNFWGISGIFDPQDPSYGVYEFKKGFGARVAEYAGMFTMDCKPALSHLYQKMIAAKNK
jgi:lipid II:glycine glycyltransferase (peptidoglycan interpeptide bridge formation enzyme)